MADHHITCAHCSAQFTTATSIQKYCNNSCAVLSKNARKSAARARKPKAQGWTKATSQQCICVVCAGPFTPKASDRTKCCSRKCGTTYSGFVVMVRKTGGRVFVRLDRNKCQTCQARHTGRGDYCSEPCRPAWYVARVDATCRGCGVPFKRTDNGAHRHYCSDHCLNEARRKSARPAKARRKALKRGSNGGETVDPHRVFIRDGWKCQGCGKPTPASRRGSYHKRAPELDHIIPVSLGGFHTYANTQCLCRECNAVKGAKIGGQLHLFPMG